MKKILVPTDFSIASRNAADYAAYFGKEIQASLVLLHIYYLPPQTASEVVSIDPLGIKKDSEEQLKQEAERLHKLTGVPVKYKIKTGYAAEEILKEEKKADFILMGIKPSSTFSQLILGSTTTTILRETIKPVIIIPQAVKYKQPKKIVLACDDDPATDLRTLEVLNYLAKKIDLQIYPVKIKQESDPISSEELITAVKLEQVLHQNEQVFYIGKKDDLVENLNHFANEKKADMIAFIPHRHDLMERLFHPGATKKIAFNSDFPLLALPDNHNDIPIYFL